MTTPQRRSVAEICTAQVLAQDRTIAALGIKLSAVEDGGAVMTMTVRADMLNSQGNCHGGMIFTLADAAFAFACISCNQAGVGAAAAIDYLRPAAEHEVLTATARVRHRGTSASLVDVVVTNQQGKQIAMLHGRSHNFGRAFLDSTRLAQATDDPDPTMPESNTAGNSDRSEPA